MGFVKSALKKLCEVICLKKLQENPNARLRSVQGIMQETNLSRYMVMQVAEAASAVIRFGKRGVRIDSERFYGYLRREVV